jgi:glycosyltransferase involved in cell wall biosynthesis
MSKPISEVNRVPAVHQAAIPTCTIAYVVKGYPRLSELFIASEIWRLEQLGISLRLYVLKTSDEDLTHRVVDDTKVRPKYLPEPTSLSSDSLIRWLMTNVGMFVPALARVVRRRPIGMAKAMVLAGSQAIRAREGWVPRKVYVKEFLQAVAVADELLREPAVGLLHGHFAHGATTVTWLASNITGIPFSFTGHAKDIYQTTLNPAGLLARKMREAEFVVTCTGANREHLAHIEPKASVHLMYHGLNADFSRLLAGSGANAVNAVNAANASESSPANCVDRCTHGVNRRLPQRPRVVSVGRMVPKKGFDVLLQATSILVERGVEFNVVIAGESGNQEDDLRELVRALHLSDVVSFEGIQTQEELFELYCTSTVFTLACRVVDDGDRDGIPNVMMEAMSTGLPVVSTNVSGIPELVQDGLNGILVESESPEALADALLRIIKDPSLAQRLGETGRSTILNRFDGEDLARQLAALFAKATHA